MRARGLRLAAFLLGVSVVAASVGSSAQEHRRPGPPAATARPAAPPPAMAPPAPPPPPGPAATASGHGTASGAANRCTAAPGHAESRGTVAPERTALSLSGRPPT